MIEERAAAGAVIERPAEGMLHQSLPVLVGLDLPQFLEPDSKFLRLAFRAKVELCHQLFAEAATRAFGE